MRELIIDGRRIADDEACYVVAEIGSNHGGSIETAVGMIVAAVQAGADAVKFQVRTNATLYSRALLEAPYENENSYGSTYGAHRAALEFSCQDLCRVTVGGTWTGFATAFDEESADLLAEIDVPAFKLCSGSLTDLTLLRYVAAIGKPMILSTGGGTYADVARAVNAIVPINSQLALLHCTASYPSVPEETNLRCIEQLREAYPELVIGFSSHSPGIALSLAAYVMGARIIEHHFTLNRASKGTDHAFSLEPKGLQTLCEDLGKLRLAMGDGVKRYYDSERGPIAKMRRRQTPEGLRITGERDAV